IDDYAYTILAQKLATVKGVSESRIFGQKQYAVHIQVNPGALAARGIGLEEVRTALTQATVNRPKGVLEGAHQAVTLDTNDQIFDAAGLRNAIVAGRDLRRHVRHRLQPRQHLADGADDLGRLRGR